MSWRDGAFERLDRGRFDLLVIGAGIVGARVAYDAGRAGLSVALVDAGDFGGGTSSVSSKLIHGGFRYLPQGRLHLVRESAHERQVLLDRVAPNLVRPLSCLLPVYEGGRLGAATVAAGLLVYHALSWPPGGSVGLVPVREAERIVPGLRTEAVELVGRFEEAQTHDARLVLATVRAAAQMGATVLNHAAVRHLEAGVAEVECGLPGEPRLEVRFGSCVNATGACVDEVRRLEDPGCSRLIRLSKGCHALLPLRWPWRAAVATPLGGGRVTVAQPWFDMLLIGTTDDEYAGPPGPVHAGPEEVRTLLDEASTALSPDVLACPVVSTFAGLRALPLGEGPTAEASREHVVSFGARGIVSVAGGKLTMHRRIALEALRRLPDDRLRGLRLDEAQLPGTGWCARRSSLVSPATWNHLERLYGADACAVAERGRERPELLEPLHIDGPDIRAQWEHAVEKEWAATPEDVLFRRTTGGLRGPAGMLPLAGQAVAAR